MVKRAENEKIGAADHKKAAHGDGDRPKKLHGPSRIRETEKRAPSEEKTRALPKAERKKARPPRRDVATPSRKKIQTAGLARADGTTSPASPAARASETPSGALFQPERIRLRLRVREARRTALSVPAGHAVTYANHVRNHVGDERVATQRAHSPSPPSRSTELP